MKRQLFKDVRFERSNTPAHVTASPACAHAFELPQELGSGNLATVWKGCRPAKPPEIKQDCDYAVKISLVTDKPELSGRVRLEYLGEDIYTQSRKEFRREVDIATKAGEMHIGPKVIEEWICPEPVYIDDHLEVDFQLGFIVMQKLDISLQQWMRRFPSKIVDHREALFNEAYRKIATLHKMDVVHTDIRGDNIMLQLDSNNNPTGLYLVDFGVAEPISPHSRRGEQQKEEDMDALSETFGAEVG